MNEKRLLTFYPVAWKQYVSWQTQGHRYVKRINKLIKSALHDGYNHGIGKPEHLRYYPHNVWSRRITKKDRLVYVVKSDLVIIASCRYHYS